MTKPQLKVQNWNPLQLCMGFVNSYHNPPSIATIFFLFLIFTDQTNWIADSGVHPSLHSTCHHLIMYCKLNLNIKYPPRYLCLVWDYNKANVESIKKSIVSVNWELMFSNTSAHKQVSFSNEGLIYFQILLHINL